MKGLVGMAAARYSGIFAEATAQSAAGFSVSPGTQMRLVHVLGGPTTVMYRLDAGESRRRRETGLGAITRMDLLDLLLSLPHECPVPYGSLTVRERHLLRSMPAGSVESRNGKLIRRAVVPLTVELAALRAYDWRRGLDRASLLAPFCSRAVILRRVPDDVDALLAEAAYYGIGVVVAEAGEVRVLADPEPFSKQSHKAAGWWFAEEVYAQVSGSAAAGCPA
jgi:hypothetical protein